MYDVVLYTKFLHFEPFLRILISFDLDLRYCSGPIQT